jgi:hypothetical protein
MAQILKKKSYIYIYNNLTLSGKRYADDATMLASIVADLNAQLDAVNTFGDGQASK